MASQNVDEIKKTWRELHKDKIKEYNRKYRKNNKEYFKNYMRNKRIADKEKAVEVAFKLLFGDA